MSDDIEINLDDPEDINIAVDDDSPISVEMPEGGMDGRSIHPAGEWSDAVEYAYLDLVTHEGSSYTAVRAVPAGTALTDTYYWQLTAEKGDPGDPGTPEWGAITGDLSDQTDLQTALDAKADVILSNASGSIASFTDGSASPVTALSVSIDPVQDLHGYNNPWPAGGGKNLADLSAFVQGSIYPNDGSEYASTTRIRSPYIAVNSGNYTVSVPSGYNIVIDAFDSNKSFLSGESLTGWSSNNTRTITVTNAKYLRILIRKSDDSTITPSTVSYVQLESGSSATSIVPYENICPISGHTSATVTRTGKNLLEVASGYTHTEGGVTMTTNADGTFTLNGTATKTFIGMFNLSYANSSINNQNDAKKYIPAGTYKLSDLGSRLRLQIYGSNSAIVTSENAVKIGDSTDTTVTIDDTYSFTYARLIILSGAVFNNETFYPWIYDINADTSSYEPYQGSSVTIDLDGTRYGGVLDVLTGEMKVTKGIVDLGTLSWSKTNLATIDVGYYFNCKVSGKKQTTDTICSNYRTAHYTSIAELVQKEGSSVDKVSINAGADGGFRIIDSAYSDAATFKTAMSGVQLVYTLNTPLTVQLSPSQLMQTLLGQNNIWADTGDVAVEYRADTKLYIDSKFSQLQALILEN